MGVIHDYLQYRRTCLSLTYDKIATAINREFKTNYTPMKVCDYFTGRRTISDRVEQQLAFALYINIDYLRFINGKLPHFVYTKYPDENAVLSMLTNWQSVYTAELYDEETY